MKLHAVNFMIALAVSAFIAFGLWSVDGELKNFIAVGSFVFLAGTLVPAIGFEYENGRRGSNVRTVCGLFFLIGLIVNLIFSFISMSATIYIIGSAISFLLFVLITNSIYSARQ